jgi:hypothetical protein
VGWELSFVAVPLALVLLWGLKSRSRDSIQLVPAHPGRLPSPRFDASPELGVLARPVQNPGIGIDPGVDKGAVHAPVVRFFALREETFDDPTTQVARSESFDDPTSPTSVPVSAPTGGFEDAVTAITATPKPPELLPKGSMPHMPAMRHPTPLFETRIEDAAAARAAIENHTGEDVTNIVPFPRARTPRSTPAREDTDSTVITSAPDRR